MVYSLPATSKLKKVYNFEHSGKHEDCEEYDRLTLVSLMHIPF